MERPITCTHCKSTYLHHFAVEVFHRSEDEEFGGRLFVATPGSTTDAPVGDDFRFDYESKHEMRGSLNPSSRRHGVLIEMICEECNQITSLRIAQHKGETLLSIAQVGFVEGGA